MNSVGVQVAEEPDATSVRLRRADLQLLKKYKEQRYGDIASEISHQRALRDLLAETMRSQKATSVLSRKRGRGRK